MGSCSSTARAARSLPALDYAEDLVRSGEFVRSGQNLVPTNPTTFECGILTVAFEQYRIRGEYIYTCELTPEMDAEVARIQCAYPHIDIRRSARLVAPFLNDDIEKIRTSLYLVRHPHYTNTVMVEWRFMGVVL